MDLEILAHQVHIVELMDLKDKVFPYHNETPTEWLRANIPDLEFQVGKEPSEHINWFQ